jgi:hypothetical protein
MSFFSERRTSVRVICCSGEKFTKQRLDNITLILCVVANVPSVFECSLRILIAPSRAGYSTHLARIPASPVERCGWVGCAPCAPRNEEAWRKDCSAPCSCFDSKSAQTAIRCKQLRKWCHQLLCFVTLGHISCAWGGLGAKSLIHRGRLQKWHQKPKVAARARTNLG